MQSPGVSTLEFCASRCASLPERFLKVALPLPLPLPFPLRISKHFRRAPAVETALDLGSMIASKESTEDGSTRLLEGLLPEAPTQLPSAPTLGSPSSAVSTKASAPPTSKRMCAQGRCSARLIRPFRSGRCQLLFFVRFAGARDTRDLLNVSTPTTIHKCVAAEREKERERETETETKKEKKVQKAQKAQELPEVLRWMCF
eukprot:scaffold1396_cov252-Pinguiococcus_pyrenoidosus.AAC.19